MHLLWYEARDYLAKHSIARFLKTFLPIIRGKKKRSAAVSPEEVGTFTRALKFSELPLIASDFVIHETTAGIRLALKRSLTERATASETRCCPSSLAAPFFSTIPRSFLSFRSRSTFLAQRRSALFKRRTFGKRPGLTRDSVGTRGRIVSISIGTIFSTLTHKTGWVTTEIGRCHLSSDVLAGSPLGHETNANAKEERRDVFDFPFNGGVPLSR